MKRSAHLLSPVAQTGWISLAAVAAFITLRSLPEGGATLHHTDFAGGQRLLEFCDPGMPAFVPVDAVPSPVQLSIRPLGPLVPGEPAQFSAMLRAASGRPIPPGDLLVNHTEKLHLLIIDPSLADYHHVHPRPGSTPGEYLFELTPQAAGRYRVFADFVPLVTGRGLYAASEFDVTGDAGEPDGRLVSSVNSDGWQFALGLPSDGLRAGRQSTMQLRITDKNGAPAPLEEIMGAYAHLVAFDRQRTGFAHLHPEPDPAGKELSFATILPEPGIYTVWAQVKIGGREIFARLAVETIP
jgi:hypothetical protein